MRLARISLSVLFLTIPVLLFAAEPPAPTIYDLKANIEPAGGSLAVQGRVVVPSSAATGSTLKFNLHETMEITKLLIDGKPATFTYAPLQGSLPLPATRGVIVNLPAPPGRGNLRMDIAYQGQLEVLPEFGASPDVRHSMDDQINPRMVELAFYSSWFPQFAYGQPVKSELTLSLPQHWIAICSGRKTKDAIAAGRSVTRWSSAKDIDIVVLASPDYKVTRLQESGVPVEIYHTHMPDTYVRQDGEQILSVLRLYTSRLGETNVPNGVVRHVYSPKRLGQGRAGFARPGLIVTSEGRTIDGLASDPNFSLFQGVAHEVAHYWWNFGAGQGDWINEAFAEYFSAVAVESLNSEADFQALLTEDRWQVSQLPPDAPSLSNVELTSQNSFVIRYYKGSLMLNAIRRALGDERFFPACKEFFETYRNKPAGTEEFRSFWKSKVDQAGLVDFWLDSRGGMSPAEENRVSQKENGGNTVAGSKGL